MGSEQGANIVLEQGQGRAGTIVNRQEQLDFLRGLAAVMVLFNHVRGAFYIGGERLLTGDPSVIDYIIVGLLQLTSFGTEAVILFFVLSGFAMANSVKLSTSTKRFYAKRIVRIWPPYIAACLLATAIGAALGIRFNLLPTLFYITPGANDLTPQFWSLPYEVLFYSLCPVILASATRIRWLFAASSLLLLITVVIRGPYLNPWPSLMLDFVGNELFLFAAGAMAYLYAERIPRLSAVRLAIAVAVALGTAWLSKRWLGEVNAVSLVAIGSVSVLAIINVDVVKRLNFGFFSYSLYLFHYALIVLASYVMGRMGIVGRDIVNPLAWVPIAVAIGLACLALYWCTERISNGLVARLRSPSPASRDGTAEVFGA